MTPSDVAAGVALDLLLGDPQWFPHPVRGIGWLATRTERVLRATRLPLRLAGALLWLTVVGVTAAAVAVTLPWATIFWIYTFLAIRSLDFEATRVIRLMPDLRAARAQLATIVGRDTQDLNEAEVVRASIETVAENLSDAVVAPLFWLALGGPVAMAAFKAASTLDSMVGYRNERYREFGMISARMDDVANWIPARLTVLLLTFAAIPCRLSASRAWRIARRDGRTQPSPNSGWPEAAFAGALGVQLGGPSTYRGILSHKATLGDPLRPIDATVWPQVRRLHYTASLIAAAGAAGVAAW